MKDSFQQNAADRNSVVSNFTEPIERKNEAADLPTENLSIPSLRQIEYQSTIIDTEVLRDYPSYTSNLATYTSENFRINALLTIPKGEMPDGGWPAIVFVHGYIPPSLYKTTERYVDYVDALARSGFVVFKIDLRGHGESEGNASGAYFSGDYVIDTLNARAALAATDYVHDEKIGLWGHSMAGNVVMRAIAVDTTIPAAVIWAGAVYTYEDMQQYGIDDNSYRPPTDSSDKRRTRDTLFETFGQVSLENEFWQSVTPITYAPEMNTAVQVHHAKNDTVVSIEYSRTLLTLLKEAGVSVELFEYELGGHDIEGSSFSQAMQRTIEFYRTHL